jgi:hypothetical protein
MGNLKRVGLEPSAEAITKENSTGVRSSLTECQGAFPRDEHPRTDVVHWGWVILQTTLWP